MLSLPKRSSLALLVLGLTSLTSLADGQSPETPIYKKQFVDLVSSLNVVYLGSFERPDTQTARNDLDRQFFALQKTAHRLQEEAGAADTKATHDGRKSDVQLRLIEQGCMSVDAVLSALTNYVATGAGTFLRVAAALKQTIDPIMTAL